MKTLRALGLLGISTLTAFLIAELGLRFVSAHWLRILDVEMWRYARLIKLESEHPGVVEEHRPDRKSVV